MTRKQQQPPSALPPTGMVKNRLQQEWLESAELPLDAATELPIDESPTLNPVERFLQELDRTKKYVLTAWALPRYAANGQTSIRTAERVWLCKLDMQPDDFEEYEYRRTVQQRWPYGGTFQFELRGPRADDDQQYSLMRRWEETLAALPMEERQRNGPDYYMNVAGSTAAPPIIYAPGAAEDKTPPPDPFAAFERQADGFLKVAKVLELLRGPVPTVVAPPAPAAADPLLQLILKKAENDNTYSLKDLFEFMRGDESKKSGGSFMDSFGEALGGGLAEFLKVVAPVMGQQTISWYQNRTGQPTATPGQGQPQQGQLPAHTQAHDIQQRWMRIIQRLIEDCVDGSAVNASAESIIDLCSRAPEIHPTVQALLHCAPTAVFDLCAQVVGPNDQQRVILLKNDPKNTEWISALQKETLRIAQEMAQQPPAQETKGEANGLPQ